MEAIVYCEGGLNNLLGKTTHGLLRFSPRFTIKGVIDSTSRKQRIGARAGGKTLSIPVWPEPRTAFQSVRAGSAFLIGVAPTGYGSIAIREAVILAIQHGLHVYSGLHQFWEADHEIATLAQARNVKIVDIRRPPVPLHMFTGEIARLTTPRLLVTGQDAAVGKRTSCFRLASALERKGCNALVVGTGQTAWFQGCVYGVRLDALPMDFAAGELELQIVRAAVELRPDILLIEGQGSLLNPCYSPETMVILTAARPQFFVYVLADDRCVYDDFPDFPLPSAKHEIALINEISGALLVGCIGRRRPVAGSEASELLCTCPSSYGLRGSLAPIAENIVRYL